jgi:hypothetical protein
VRFVDLLDLEISLPLEFCFVAQEAAHEANPTLKRFLDLLT